MTRIPLLPPEDARAAAEPVGVTALAADLNVFRAWLHGPQLAGWRRLRELVIMRLGWSTASDDEWTQHWRIATEFFGVDGDDLMATRDWRDSDRFGPAERAILAATDDVVATACAATSLLLATGGSR